MTLPETDPVAAGRTYTVKELFYTLQGEGLRAGRPAVFCRFTGCNLWTGRAEDRASAECSFCDTDFLGTDGPGGGRFVGPQALAEAIAACWPSMAGIPASEHGLPYVVFTGGEPTLQVDEALCWAVHQKGFEIAIETNGTRPVSPGVDWICVSPKAGTTLVQTTGDELKVVYPQSGQDLVALAALSFSHHLLQPLDDPQRADHTAAALQYCLSHPRWRLSLQTHKMLGIP